ncbi:hypothetical protein K438DRAFT_1982288 [Mycena galopus ATCC 62051]|nr:hypothetical protein K438DRAFT_1982288 [Mycena galopus ATCC 62051]
MAYKYSSIRATLSATYERGSSTALHNYITLTWMHARVVLTDSAGAPDLVLVPDSRDEGFSKDSPANGAPPGPFLLPPPPPDPWSRSPPLSGSEFALDLALLVSPSYRPPPSSFSPHSLSVDPGFCETKVPGMSKAFSHRAGLLLAEVQDLLSRVFPRWRSFAALLPPAYVRCLAPAEDLQESDDARVGRAETEDSSGRPAKVGSRFRWRGTGLLASRTFPKLNLPATPQPQPSVATLPLDPDSLWATGRVVVPTLPQTWPEVIYAWDIAAGLEF